MFITEICQFSESAIVVSRSSSFVPGLPMPCVYQVVPVPQSRVGDLVDSGEICDGKSVIGLLILISSMEKNKE